MDIKRLGLQAATATLLVLSGPFTWAAGFGEPTSTAVLGQPLNFAVPVRLDAAATLDARCVKAEVSVGERSLPEALVSTAIEPTGIASVRLRVATSTRVEEPVVSVLVQVGCGSSLSRRFFVLADPPGFAAFSTAEPAIAVAALAVPMVPGPSEPDSSEQAQPEGASPGSARNTARGTAPTSAPVQRARVQPTEAAARPQRQRQTTARARPVALAVSDTGPRLRLEAPLDEPGLTAAEMVAVEQALQAVADAASAITAANQAASAAAQRAEDLQRTLDQVRADTQAQRDAAAVMRERLSRSEAMSDWIWPLLVGLLALGGLAAWLSWQMMLLRRDQQQSWQAAKEQATAQALSAVAAANARAGADNPGGSPADTRADTVAGLAAEALAGKTPTAPQSFDRGPAPRPKGQGAPAWPPPAPAEDFMPSQSDSDAFVAAEAAEAAAAAAASRPATLSAAAAPAAPVQPPARDLSIEELIDLEQQAEFFIVLGQDESAIDLLVEHTRATGGSSPLPYLKLLEIYRRLGDREAFERTRRRFNQRFNAYAAEWGTSLDDGRSLEDYPGVLPRLELAWSSPLDAMAELEALLFRKSHGELFDLPAYREVLFLYALARDLLDRESVSTGTVDLLLPLSDGGEFSATAPHPYFGLDHDSVFDRTATEPAPTSPVDLDLSQATIPERIIDPLPPRKRKKPVAKP